MALNKIFENERMFHELNTGLANRTAALVPSDFPKDLVLELYCECANKACTDRISIAYDEYIEVAKDPLKFAVMPDHMFPEFEQVVRKYVNHWIILKRLDKLGKRFEL
jgi:hypothetical protein